MTLGIDTDVLVHWTMAGAQHHESVRRFLQREVGGQGTQLGLAPQVLFEFVHVCTDPRRFAHPLAMEEALLRAREIWDAPETVRVLPGATFLHRTFELLRSHRLGRKRILDTALAATLEGAGIRRLATLNGRDFEAFGFLEIADPR